MFYPTPPLIALNWEFPFFYPDATTVVIYVGNARGDILAAHLSLSDLAALSGDSQGPVPCQRRANHNPNRAVRFKLTARAANSSLRDARHAQEALAPGGGGSATTEGVGGESRAGTAGHRFVCVWGGVCHVMPNRNWYGRLG